MNHWTNRPRYPQDIPKISQRYSKDIPKISQSSVSIFCNSSQDARKPITAVHCLSCQYDHFILVFWSLPGRYTRHQTDLFAKSCTFKCSHSSFTSIIIQLIIVDVMILFNITSIININIIIYIDMKTHVLEKFPLFKLYLTNTINSLLKSLEVTLNFPS